MRQFALTAIGLAAAASLGIAAAQQKQAGGPLIEIYKSPTCGCCSKWVEHMRASGFTVKTTDVDDIMKVKATHGVPDQLQSCHTGIVQGYVVEGHVPAADVQRLLKEKPAVVGIATPGMPVGSPGMEVPNVKSDPYNVMAFDKKGGTSVFAKH